MDGENPVWSVEAVLEHINRVFEIHDAKYEQRFEAQEKAVAAALDSAKTAVNKADEAAQKRFEAVNEFRALVTDLIRTLMPRAEAEIAVRELSRRIADLERGRGEGSARGSGVKEGVALIVSGIALLAALAGFLK